MFGRIVLSALLAGLVGGLMLTGLQMLRVVPTILEAEGYESAGHTHGDAAGSEHHEHPGNDADKAHDHRRASSLYSRIVQFQNAGVAWAPQDGVERSAYTALANVLIAIGFALLLAAALALRARVSAGQGLLWGLAGYAVFFVLPGIGLPPELPGTVAAELVDRQGWWLLTVTCSAFGLALLVLQRQWALKLVGAAVLLVPHLVGAPQAEVTSTAAPEALWVSFVWATAAVNGVFWLVLGGLTAATLQRLRERASR